MSPHQRSNKTNRLSYLRFLRALWLGWQTAPSALQPISSHHLFDHAHSETLLKPTKLAPVTTTLVDRTVFVGQANILGVLLNCPLEEALAAFTGSNPVVLTRGIVTAHRAEEGAFALPVS